jgi:hypothetical protein
MRLNRFGTIAVSDNIGTVCQAAGKTAAGEGRARHSVRAGAANQNALVGKRAAGRGLPALPAPMCQSQCELLYVRMQATHHRDYATESELITSLDGALRRIAQQPSQIQGCLNPFL